MMELIDTLPQEVTLLANGNRMKVPTHLKKDNLFMNSPEVRKRSQIQKDESAREKQFSDLITHVISQIERESADDSIEEDQSQVSLLDLKTYLKESISVMGVSENSPVFVIDSVSNKLGHALHNFNVFEIGQFAACTKAEIANIVAQTNHIQGSEVEFAHQDAKSIVNILLSLANNKKREHTKEKEKEPAWGISQVSSILQIKQIKKNTKKMANLMGNIIPKNISTSIVDVFVGQSQPDSSEGEDIDTFYKM